MEDTFEDEFKETKVIQYLAIKSKGEMEPLALSLIGASTKRGDGKSIGMFGSGLKYSMATMLRQKIKFRIFSGMKELKVTTKPMVFGEQSFNQLYINGNVTSLTDSMGTEDWKGAWPYIREIYSNALDEGTATIKVVDREDVIPESGYTIYFLEINDLTQDIIENFEQYFVTKSKHIYADDKDNFFFKQSGKGVRIFRKGIVVHHDKFEKKVLFDYDLNSIAINESRTIGSVYSAQSMVGAMYEACTDTAIITRFMQHLSGGNTGSFEHSCVLSKYASEHFSAEFVAYCTKGKFYPVEIEFMLEAKDKIGRLCLPLSILYRMIMAYSDCDVLGMTTQGEGGDTDGMYFEVKEPSMGMKDKIAEAVKMLNNTVYGPRLGFPIHVCRFKGSTVMGRFHDNKCWLSDKLELHPSEAIATIIIEEMEHGHSGHGDKTRAFQNHLFKLLFSSYGTSRHIVSAREEAEKSQKVIDDYSKLNWFERMRTKIK